MLWNDINQPKDHSESRGGSGLVAKSWLSRSHGPSPARLFCPWYSPGMNTGMGCHFLLQEIFPTQESNPGLLHCSQILYWLSYHEAHLWLMVESIMEKAMAPHSSTLAWEIPWMEEPGRLQAMGLLRVGHNWAASLWLFTFLHWRRKWQPTPVFLPRESQGWGSLVGCHLWGRTESDPTEAT